MKAASCRAARDLDAAAIGGHGLSESALIDAAAKGCADALERLGPIPSPTAVIAGAGNNAADALGAAVILAARGVLVPADLTVVLRSEKERAALSASGSQEPFFASRLRALAERGAAVAVWDGPEGKAAAALRASRLILDGLFGTGLSGPARGAGAEIIAFLNALSSADGGLRKIVAVDLPSGLSDAADPSCPILRAEATRAVEPVKACLYRPFARSFAGRILPVSGVFPASLLEAVPGIPIVSLIEAAAAIPPVPPDAYKHRRGLVEIHAGSVGAVGAAKLAARGAAAAGAGLVRIVADPDIWMPLAASESGAMVRRKGSAEGGREAPADAYLIGPGWGPGPGRRDELENLLSRDGAFVLDADALALLAPHEGDAGSALPPTSIATPHPREFSRFACVDQRVVETDPDGPLLEEAAKRGATIILKGHLMRVAAPDGRLAYVDGMEPVLATGGSGDVLAGLVAALAARSFRAAGEGGGAFDPFSCALAGAALLVEAGKAARKEAGFCDAAEFARQAARIAGRLWLGGWD